VPGDSFAACHASILGARRRAAPIGTGRLAEP
jgi:hypothetical protein